MREMSYCLAVDTRKQSYWLNATEKGNGGHDQLTPINPKTQISKIIQLPTL